MSRQLTYAKGTLAAPSADEELVFTASAEGTNRYGFSLNAKHWRLDNFNANPVILWMHNDRQPPIGRGRASIDGSGLKTAVQFDRQDPLAMEIERKYRSGFLNAVSVGFDFVDKTGSPILDWYSMSVDEIFNESYYDLAEVSAVPVPADPNALIRQRHALAFDFGMTAEDLQSQWKPKPVEKINGPVDLTTIMERLTAMESKIVLLSAPANPPTPPVVDPEVPEELDEDLASTLLASLSLSGKE